MTLQCLTLRGSISHNFAGIHNTIIDTMLQWGARSFVRFGLDLACVAISPFVALLIRDNFATSLFSVEAVVPYALLCILAAGVVFRIARLHQALWRYTTLADIFRIAAAAAIVLLIAL